VGQVNLFTYSDAVVVSHQLDRTLVFDNKGLLSEDLLIQMQESVASLAVEASVLFCHAERMNKNHRAYIKRIYDQVSPLLGSHPSEAAAAAAVDRDDLTALFSRVPISPTSSLGVSRRRLSRNRYYMHGINPTILSENTLRLRLNIIEISAQYPMDACVDSVSARPTSKRGRCSADGRRRTRNAKRLRVSSKREAAPRFDVWYTPNNRSLLLTEIKAAAPGGSQQSFS
jgi:hypothetical protein